MYKDKKGLTVEVMKGDVKPKGLAGDDWRRAPVK